MTVTNIEFTAISNRIEWVKVSYCLPLPGATNHNHLLKIFVGAKQITSSSINNQQTQNKLTKFIIKDNINDILIPSLVIRYTKERNQYPYKDLTFRWSLDYPNDETLGEITVQSGSGANGSSLPGRTFKMSSRQLVDLLKEPQKLIEKYNLGRYQPDNSSSSSNNNNARVMPRRLRRKGLPLTRVRKPRRKGVELLLDHPRGEPPKKTKRQHLKDKIRTYGA